MLFRSTTSTTAPNGVVWGKTLGGTGADHATGVDFAGAAIFVGGHFRDTADVNWSTASDDDRTSAGFEDSFLSKFDDAGGTLSWTKTWGGSSNDVANDLVIDRSNNDVYIGGYLGDTEVDYDPGSGTVMIGGDSGGQGGQDSWISKFNVSWDPQWAKNFGANGHDKIEGMAAASGNVYATGYQKGTAGDWDTGTGTIQLGSGNSYDPFTIKLNSSGLTQWAFSVGGSSGYEAGWGVTTDNSEIGRAHV